MRSMRSATFAKNQQRFQKRLVSNDEVFLVGGDDVYQPVCKKHFYE